MCMGELPAASVWETSCPCQQPSETGAASVAQTHCVPGQVPLHPATSCCIPWHPAMSRCSVTLSLK